MLEVQEKISLKATQSEILMAAVSWKLTMIKIY